MSLSDVMVRVPSVSVEVHVFEPWLSQTKVIKLIFASSPLSMQHSGVRAMNVLPRVKIMCLCKVAFLPVDCMSLHVNNPVSLLVRNFKKY